MTAFRRLRCVFTSFYFSKLFPGFVIETDYVGCEFIPYYINMWFWNAIHYSAFFCVIWLHKNSLFPQDPNKQNMFCIYFMGSTTRNLTFFLHSFFLFKNLQYPTHSSTLYQNHYKLLFFSQYMTSQTNRRLIFLFSLLRSSKHLILSEGRENSLFQVAVNVTWEKYACVYSYLLFVSMKHCIFI